MKKLFTLMFLFGFIIPSWAQSLSPFIISASGGYYSAGGYSLSSTTGEMTMVKTFSNGSILTQGFEQPNDFYVDITELSVDNNTSVYPNPNNGSFTLMISLKKDADILVRVYDVLSREVYTDKLNHSAGINKYALQLPPAIADGIYWMILRTENKSEILLNTTKKINIIH